MRQMSAGEERVYRFIVNYKRAHDGNSPTIREIGDAIYITSLSHVWYYLNRLAERGLIRMSDARARSIEVAGGQWSPPGGD